MAGPSTHGQRNKSHKAGKHAGVSARQKHRVERERVPGARPSNKGPASGSGGKADRLLATELHRDAKRQELIEKKRKLAAPLLVALLPLSDAVDAHRLWALLLGGCEDAATVAARGGGVSSSGGGGANGGGHATAMDFELEAAAGVGLSLVTVCPHSRPKTRLTLLPPPAARHDPLAIVDLCRAAEVVLLAMPGAEGAKTIDAAGEMALSVLRALGLPTLCGVVQGSSSSSSAAASVAAGGGKNAAQLMKDRSAEKKRCEKALAALVGGEPKVLHADTAADCQQLMRHLEEHPSSVPLWRTQRPSLIVQAAEYRAQDGSGGTAAASTSGGDGGGGALCITGYVRCAGLSANQLVTIPGCGDFQITCITAPVDRTAPSWRGGGGGGGRNAMDTSGGGEGGGGGVGAPPVLAAADPDAQEALVRENVPDPLDGEQTWPTAAEMADAAAGRMMERQRRKKRVPAGTSEYQAAWIVDTDSEDDEDDDNDDGEDAMNDGEGANKEDDSDDDDEELPALEEAHMAAADGEGDVEAMEEDDADGRLLYERLRAQRAAAAAAAAADEGDETGLPDEVETPQDVAARVRFQKYRGLKSFRTSPWDPKEDLPQDYARVFAFENFRRAHRRAKDAVGRATEGTDPSSVGPGTYVTLHVAGVSAQQAAAVVQRVRASLAGSAPPLTVTGLMAHEAKMSVVNFNVRKATGYAPAIRNKEQLLFVTGTRSFLVSPILSSDSNANKHKMEKVLAAGNSAVASVFAPICYSPLPLLAFKLQPPGSAAPPQLAAVGSLKSCDPDRVVLKKIVLTGYPVRAHKRKAVVRFMFHNPDDIRWFKPVELWTKHGRRGRITEPVGTHGAMKCVFDGIVQQHDTICMSLYKRVYPKWPADLTFA